MRMFVTHARQRGEGVDPLSMRRWGACEIYISITGPSEVHVPYNFSRKNTVVSGQVVSSRTVQLCTVMECTFVILDREKGQAHNCQL